MLTTITQVRRTAQLLEKQKNLAAALSFIAGTDDNDLFLYFKEFKDSILKRQAFIMCSDDVVARLMMRIEPNFFK